MKDLKFDLENYGAKIVTYVEMEYRKFEELVSDAYGLEMEFVEEEESSNYSNHTYDFSKYTEGSNVWRGEDKEKIQSQIRSGSLPEYGMEYLFATLIEDGYIPPANYLIEVSW